CGCPEEAEVVVEPVLRPNVVTANNETLTFPGACSNCGALAPDGAKILGNDIPLRLFVGRNAGIYRDQAAPFWASAVG
ncbi:MAG: hypothetical protein M3N19_00050, partial [Candidatus Eremiobacteraeota bacterium]|nr:hypothetical protein [Candidatus Eremiobacteraeota bacterium]